MTRPRRVFLLGLSAAAAATLAMAGCASGSGSGGGSGTLAAPSSSLGSTTETPGSTTATAPTTSRTPEPTVPAGGPRTLSLSFAANGTSFHLMVGQRLHIELATPYWTFHPSDTPGVLRQDASGVATPTATCSGPTSRAGCGIRTADYTAIGAGRTTVVATRVVCGEAMRCTGSAGRFTVYVAVD